MINRLPYTVKSLLKAGAFLFIPSLIAAEPFLWKVETDPPSYLFGTVHSDHPSVREIPGIVTEALAASRSFHPELEFTPQAMGEMAAHLFRMDNPDLEPQLPPELWERLRRNAARAGLPEMMLQKIPLELAGLPFATNPNTDFAQVLDVQLYQLAVSGSLEIKALETFPEQVGAFMSMTEEEALRFLEVTLDEFENDFPGKKEILRLYSAGDLDALNETVKKEFEQLESDRLLKVFLTDRNEVMVRRMLPFLERGGAFVAVGVGHMAGDGSIIELLGKEGMTVRRVKP